MIAAVVAVGIVAGAITTIAVLAITATGRAGDEKAARMRLEEQLKVSRANEQTQTARADAEKERGDALDAAIAQCAANAVGPVAGSYAELLQAAAAARARAAGRRDPAVVRDTGAPSRSTEADRRGPDDLQRPGE